MGQLTPKRAKFCVEYLIDLNGTQAAIRAGYAESGARTEAARLLADADIVEELNRLRADIAAKTGITPERILQEYQRIGFHDIRKAVKWKSNLLTEVTDPDTGEAAGVYQNSVALVDSDDLDDDTAMAISEIKMDSRGGLSIKMHDKKAALDSMAKHLGMFDGKKGVDDPEETGEAQDLRAFGRKMAFVLAGALGKD